MEAHDDSAMTKLRDVLRMARRDIVRGRGHGARRLLAGEEKNFVVFRGQELYAEYLLTLAEAAAGVARRDESFPEVLFKDALDEVRRLVPQQLDLLVRAHESLGSYLSGTVARKGDALEELAKAKAFAVRLGNSERTAELNLQIELINLRSGKTKDPVESENLATLRSLAVECGWTSQDQWLIWNHHVGSKEQAMAGMLYARAASKASRDYFIRIYETVRT